MSDELYQARGNSVYRRPVTLPGGSVELGFRLCDVAEGVIASEGEPSPAAYIAAALNAYTPSA